MNKRIMFIVLITFQLWCLAWADSYLIYLRNGNELRTSYYWEEGEDIKFYVYGGVAGIPKHSVTGFKKFTSNYQEHKEKIENDITLKGQKMIDKKSVQSTDGQISVRADGNQSETIDAGYYKEKKAELKGKLEEALEKNREATRLKDPEAKEATRQEMLKHAKRLHALEDELREKNNGTLPDWWEE